MNISNALRLRTAVFCFGAAALFSGSAASALNAQSWNGYTWGRTGNLTIQLVNNTSATWTPYVQAAADQWSAAANIDYRVVTGPAINTSVCSPTYGVVEVCSANYGKTGWLGMANVYTSGGHIVMGTVRYNDYYPLTSAYYAQSAWYANTSCHELGHILGLDHQDSNKGNANDGSCLDLSSDPTGKRAANGPLTNYTPNAVDFANLADIYKTPSGTQLASTTYAIGSDGSFVPEPATWALMLAGFGLVGTTMRRRSLGTATVTA